MTPSEDEQILEEAFAMADTNCDNSIETKEICHVMRVLGFNPTEKEIDKWIDDYDLDKSGRLEFGEFKKFYTAQKQELYNTINADKMIIAFSVFDKNGNGLIEKSELQTILKGMGGKNKSITDDEVADMIACADLNNDGMLNYKEFAHFICKKPGPSEQQQQKQQQKQ